MIDSRSLVANLFSSRQEYITREKSTVVAQKLGSIPVIQFNLWVWFSLWEERPWFHIYLGSKVRFRLMWLWGHIGNVVLVCWWLKHPSSAEVVGQMSQYKLITWICSGLYGEFGTSVLLFNWFRCKPINSVALNKENDGSQTYDQLKIGESSFEISILSISPSPSLNHGLWFGFVRVVFLLEQPYKLRYHGFSWYLTAPGSALTVLVVQKWRVVVTSIGNSGVTSHLVC